MSLFIGLSTDCQRGVSANRRSRHNAGGYRHRARSQCPHPSCRGHRRCRGRAHGPREARAAGHVGIRVEAERITDGNSLVCRSNRNRWNADRRRRARSGDGRRAVACRRRKPEDARELSHRELHREHRPENREYAATSAVKIGAGAGDRSPAPGLLLLRSFEIGPFSPSGFRVMKPGSSAYCLFVSNT